MDPFSDTPIDQQVSESQTPEAEGEQFPYTVESETPEQPAEEPAKEQVQEPEPEAEAPQDEKLELLRQIASSPEKRQAYEMAMYGQSAVQQAPQQPQAQPQRTEPEPPQLPFAPEDFDPTSFEHQMAMLNHVVSQQLNPALSYINELKEYEQTETQQREQEQQQQQLKQVETDIVSSFEKHMPGYGELYKAKAPTTEQKALITFTEREFQEEMRLLHPPTGEINGQPFNPLWLNPRAQKEIVDRIGARVKTMADKLGVFNEKPAKKVSGVYVEGANNVPASSSNPFEQAAKNGNTASMFEAIGYTA